ncbi:hypothetical protein ACH42_02990 [Endozoicomonas sp. (ex Bugula neritina AB1)]|nr:hypothetical protein ACH42_02990 [Endozoicomonas sp. (ex Bugula neritina AB1)]
MIGSVFFLSGKISGDSNTSKKTGPFFGGVRVLLLKTVPENSNWEIQIKQNVIFLKSHKMLSY